MTTIHIHNRRQRGLSLLEILFAIILLSLVIMATAMVYPGGYKLNATNKYASQATSIAQGIIEEIKMRPFSKINIGVNTDAFEYFSIEDIAKECKNNPIENIYLKYKWPFHSEQYDEAAWKANCPVLCWDIPDNPTPKGVYEILTDPRNNKFFFLAPYNSNNLKVPPGIIVDGYGDGDGQYEEWEWRPIPSPQPISPHMAKVQVSVSWIEFRNKEPIAKSVTLTSWVTQNKNE